MPVNVASHTLMFFILQIALWHIQCRFGIYLILFGFQIRAEYKHWFNSITRALYAWQKHREGITGIFFSFSKTQQEGHLHRICLSFTQAKSVVPSSAPTVLSLNVCCGIYPLLSCHYLLPFKLGSSQKQRAYLPHCYAPAPITVSGVQQAHNNYY